MVLLYALLVYLLLLYSSSVVAEELIARTLEARGEDLPWEFEREVLFASVCCRSEARHGRHGR